MPKVPKFWDSLDAYKEKPGKPAPSLADAAGIYKYLDHIIYETKIVGLSFCVEYSYEKMCFEVEFYYGDGGDMKFFATLHKTHTSGVSSDSIKDVLTCAIEALVPYKNLSTLGLKANEGTTMALNIKSFNAMATLKKVGVPQALFDWLSANGCASYSNGTMTFATTEQSVTVHMSISHAQAANLGKLPSHVKQEYQLKFGAALKNLHEKVVSAKYVNPPILSLNPNIQSLSKGKTLVELYGLPPLENASSDVEQESKYGKPNPFKKLDPAELAKPYSGPTHWTTEDAAKLAKAQAPVNGAPQVFVVSSGVVWPTFDLDQLKTATLIPLYEADKLYQPVMGSTHGKRYYCMALNSVFRLGVAYQNGEVSFRIESPQWAAYHSKLNSIPGLAVKNGYASFHLAVADEQMARKVVGAFIADTGIAWDTPLPNVSIIKA